MTNITDSTVGAINNKETESVPYDKLVDNNTRQWLETVFFAILCGLVSLVGSVGNIINIIIFLKQGFRDSVNISFFALAVSDLGSLLFLAWMSICFNPLFRYSDINFESVEVQYLTSGIPKLCFARVTSWITAFIALERCICVTIPLKVKTIITARRTLIIVLAIYVVMAISVVPVFTESGFISRFDKAKNKTMLHLYQNDENIEKGSFSFSLVSQIASFIIVLVCTAVLSQNLLWSAKWRVKITESGDQSLSKETRVIKTVALISGTFIICYLPSAVNMIMMSHFEVEYSVNGIYNNTLQATWSVFNFLEAINGSINIIVYYKMSSRFKLVFNHLFGFNKSKQ